MTTDIPMPADQMLAERSLLGLLTQRTNPADVLDITAQLEADAFQHPTHETVLRAITAAAAATHAGGELNRATIAAKLTAQGDALGAASATILEDLDDAVDSLDVIAARKSELIAWVGELNRRAERRRLRSQLSSALARLQDGVDGDLVAAKLTADLMRTSSSHEQTEFTVDEAIDMAAQWRAEAAQNGGKPRLSSGSTDLDKALGVGTEPGKMTIVAARPTHGKTTAVLDVSRAWLKQGVGVIGFSLEMGMVDVWQRMMSAETSIPYTAFQTGAMDAEQLSKLSRKEDQYRDEWRHLLVVETDPYITAEQIALRIQQQKLAWERAGIIPGGFFVDYIQKLTPSNPREEKRVTIGAACSLLTNVAKSTGMHALLAAQINREGDSQPTMAHLKDSGDLEQDAENVIIIDRPSVRDEADRPGEADFLIGKARKSVPGVTITRASQLEYQRFADITRRSVGSWQ